ncbi:extended synaptotagmin-3 [Osmerus mordax]|uniref:extended synaptotagmin-3 n=1 Tax=Osmerus mordax TaxID=8014 RepID=UPI00350EED70
MRRRDALLSESGGIQQHQNQSQSLPSAEQPVTSTSNMNPDAFSDTGTSGGGSPVQELSPSAVNQMLMEFLMYFGRAILFFYPVYLTGYFGFSISWVLLCMMMITWWKKNRKWKDVRIDSAINFFDNEKQVIIKELKTLNMASWVHFPDVERVDWLNKILQQAWPFFGMFMEKLLKEKIQPSIRLSSPHLKTFSFTKVHFGQKPVKITGVQVYTHEVDKSEVILDMNVSYDGDVDIDAQVKPAISAGVKGVQFQGMLRVILEPLVGQAPLVGGVTMFFIRRPTLQINWTGMTNLLDTPALSHISEGAIMDIIASLMVLPNRMCFPLIDQVKVDQMMFPLPRGVVRVHLLEARDLVAKDTYMLGMVKGKSDPYAILKVGNRQVKSKTIFKNLHPRWNEIYEFVVHEAPGQDLELELYDEDTDKDDFLGSFNLDFGEVKREKEMDQWFRLEETQSGEVHLRLQWLSLQTDQSLLAQTTDGCACAMLAVYLNNASNLPTEQSEFSHNEKHGKHDKQARLTKRSANNLNSYVEFSIAEQSRKSKIVYGSKDPVWEECFTFFVHSVTNQQLNIQVKKPDKKVILGTLDIPMSRLLGASDMTLDQRFLLERSGAISQVQMKATLRILKIEKPQPKVVKDPPPQRQPQAQPSQSSQGGTGPPPASSSALPSSHAQASAHAQTTSAGAPSFNGHQGDYVSQRHGSFLATDTRRTAPATPLMRRYDSHSLLSENSIASSRFDLTEGASYPEAIMNHQGTFGDIQITVRYATLRTKLIVLVNSCRNLVPCGENGSDAYVRLYLLPDQSWKHRVRTQVKRRTVNPVFNEKFEFDASIQEAATRKLDVAVKNNRMFHTRERKEIGKVLIDLSQLDLAKGSTDWYELTLPGLRTTS